MGTSINNSFILPTDFPLAEAAASNSGTPDSTSGQAPTQGQGGRPPATGTATISAYGALQGAQGQGGQNVNMTLGQALGATQGSIADPGSTGGDNDLSGILSNDGGTPQLVDVGLSADQQVVGNQQGSRGKKDSDTGSGYQSEQGQVYMGTAASGLQKGQGVKSSTAVGSSHPISNFTLKVDSTESTSSTETTQSTSYTDSNGAPKIPNVYAMVADCTELSENLNGYTVSDMVAASKGQNNDLSQEYSKQITDINNYIQSKQQASSKSAVANAFSWVINIAMIAVGCITADPMLVAAGVMGCVLTADPKITAGLTNALEKIGIPAQAANILATLIIIGAASVGGFAVGAVAMGALRAGSEAAVQVGTESAAASTANSAVASSTTSTTQEASATAAKAAAQPINWTATLSALQTSAGMSAFMQGAAEGAARTIVEAPANIASSIANIPTAVANSTASLYQLAARVSEACISLGSKSLTEMIAEIGIGAAQATEMSADSLRSLFSNMTSMQALKMVQIAADLTMATLSGAGAVIQYSASMLGGEAEKNQAHVLQSQAQTTELNTLISLGSSQIQTVLDDMNSAVVNAGQVLSEMNSLSSETLGQLNRGAA